MGGPAGSKEVAKRRTEAKRRERLRTQARQGAAINKTVGPTLIEDVGGLAGSKEVAKRRTEAKRTVGPTLIEGKSKHVHHEEST